MSVTVTKGESNVGIRQTVKFTTQLFKDTFNRKGAYSIEIRNVQASLYTKSWMIHCVMMFSRVAYPLLGIAFWQKAYDGKDENPVLN